MDAFIAGIDPGTTIGFALIRLDGSVADIGSFKQHTLAGMIKKLSSYGSIIAIGTDKANIPGFVSKLATKLGARAISPKADLLVSEKKELVLQAKKQFSEAELLGLSLSDMKSFSYMKDLSEINGLSEIKESLIAGNYLASKESAKSQTTNKSIARSKLPVGKESQVRQKSQARLNCRISPKSMAGEQMLKLNHHEFDALASAAFVFLKLKPVLLKTIRVLRKCNKPYIFPDVAKELILKGSLSIRHVVEDIENRADFFSAPGKSMKCIKKENRAESLQKASGQSHETIAAFKKKVSELSSKNHYLQKKLNDTKLKLEAERKRLLMLKKAFTKRKIEEEAKLGIMYKNKQINALKKEAAAEKARYNELRDGFVSLAKLFYEGYSIVPVIAGSFSKKATALEKLSRDSFSSVLFKENKMFFVHAAESAGCKPKKKAFVLEKNILSDTIILDLRQKGISTDILKRLEKLFQRIIFFGLSYSQKKALKNAFLINGETLDIKQALGFSLVKSSSIEMQPSSKLLDRLLDEYKQRA